MPKICIPTLYLGIDPGQAGGVAILLSRASGLEVAGIHPMPETERDIWNLFFGVPHLPYQRVAMIERVHSMPNQSAQSGFTFGAGYGGLRMAIIACGIPFEEVTPQSWQKAFGIKPRGKEENKGQFKKRLRAKAQQLFPSLAIWNESKSLGRQLAIADALLIAEFCRRKHNGLLG